LAATISKNQFISTIFIQVSQAYPTSRVLELKKLSPNGEERDKT
jgi:hypothetical protein